MTDPMHNDRDLQNGLYILERYMGFSLEDIALLFRHSRPAAIGYLPGLTSGKVRFGAGFPP